MLEFAYAGNKEDEELDLASRVLREIGPLMEGDLISEVGEATVEREGLGKGLLVKVTPRAKSTNSEDQVIEQIGKSLMTHLLDIVYENPGGPILSQGGQLASGRVDGRKLGL